MVQEPDLCSCLPETDSIRETMLKEAHDSAYSIHPGSTKMYQDLKQKIGGMD